MTYRKTEPIVDILKPIPIPSYKYCIATNEYQKLGSVQFCTSV